MGTHGRGSANHKLADFLGRAKILCRESNPERDPYAELGYAIVMQALVDWLRGQEKIQKEYGADNLQELRTKFPSKEEWGKIRTPKIANMIDAERFFKSDYCEDLCGISGSVILERLKAGKTLKLKHLVKNKQFA